MPALPVAPVNGINQGLFPFHVNQEFFRQYVQLLPFWNLIGNEMTRPIVRHQMKAGEGWQYRISKLNALNYLNAVYDFDQVSGNGQYQQVDVMAIDTRKISIPVTLKGRDLITLGTPIDLPSAIRPQLIEASQRLLNKDLLDAATTGMYAPATQLPSYDRAVLAGSTPTRANWNGYAGITTALNNLNGGVAYNQNGLSANHLLTLKKYAGIGGAAANTEDMVRPAFIKSRAGWPMNEYIYLAHPATIQTLYQDPMFFQAGPARGTVIDTMAQPQAIYGCDYIGKFFGIHIYEVRDLAAYELTSQNGTYTVAWNMLIGAGAWSLGWYEEPYIAFRDDTIDTYQMFTTHEVRGQAVARFPAKLASTIAANAPVSKLIEQGIIHSFVRIA